LCVEPSLIQLRPVKRGVVLWTFQDLPHRAISAHFDAMRITHETPARRTTSDARGDGVLVDLLDTNCMLPLQLHRARRISFSFEDFIACGAAAFGDGYSSSIGFYYIGRQSLFDKDERK
jgi:hypothetical protein